MSKFNIIFENVDLNVPNAEWINMFGDFVKKYVTGEQTDLQNKAKIKGTRDQINSFMEALKQERKYFLLAQKEGAMSRDLMEQENLVKKAVETFEQITKIPWPIR